MLINGCIGHNWYSHRTLEEREFTHPIVWNLVGDAVQLLQMAIGEDKKRYISDYSYMEFILTGNNPRVVPKDTMYHFCHLYEVLKLTDEVIITNK